MKTNLGPFIHFLPVAKVVGLLSAKNQYLKLSPKILKKISVLHYFFLTTASFIWSLGIQVFATGGPIWSMIIPRAI